VLNNFTVIAVSPVKYENVLSVHMHWSENATNSEVHRLQQTFVSVMELDSYLMFAIPKCLTRI